MHGELGTLDDLPIEYRDALAAQSIAPLWPMMRNVLPRDKPSAVTKPSLTVDR